MHVRLTFDTTQKNILKRRSNCEYFSKLGGNTRYIMLLPEHANAHIASAKRVYFVL